MRHRFLGKAIAIENTVRPAESKAFPMNREKEGDNSIANKKKVHKALSQEKPTVSGEGGSLLKIKALHSQQHKVEKASNWGEGREALLQPSGAKGLVPVTLS